jgi:uncharacterized protein YndB with AHSA1/START domain
MPEVSTSQLLNAPADAVWRLLADFGAIERWWPKDGPAPIEGVTVEGTGVGMVRHIQNRGMEHAVSERLDLLDPATRTLVLSIIGRRPVGLTGYVAEGRVVDAGPGQCRIDYRALVTTEPGREEQVRKALLKTWSVMFRGLETGARVA